MGRAAVGAVLALFLLAGCVEESRIPGSLGQAEQLRFVQVDRYVVWGWHVYVYCDRANGDRIYVTASGHGGISVVPKGCEAAAVR